MRILFLGNSFTFFNDLPDMVGQILSAEIGRNLRGGAYLYQHIDPTDELCAVTRQLLTEENRDYVVLQDQSQGPITNPEAFRQAVNILSPMIRAAAQANDALIAPVGQVFLTTRHTSHLYDADHYHPSAAGSQLAAETIAAVFWAEKFACSPCKLTFAVLGWLRPQKEMCGFCPFDERK